jgi:hypothetical protein
MTEIISAAVLLILIMDPLGNLPIFMSVLKHTEPKRRRAIMIRELLIALGVMFIFPQPDGPVISVNSPGESDKSTFWSILLPPTLYPTPAICKRTFSLFMFFP